MSQQANTTQLMQQRAIFDKEYYSRRGTSNEISAADREAWIARQDQLIVEARAREAQQRSSSSSQQVSSGGSNVSPTGSDPTTTVAVQQGNKLWVRSDYEVAETKTEPVEGGGSQTTLVLQPKNQPAQQSPALSNDLFSGKRNTGPIDGKPILDTNEKRLTALEVISVAAMPVAAPLVGIKGSSVVVGEALGVGLGQVPNVIKASQGQQVTTEDIAKAGLEGAVVGGAFSVVGGAAISKLGLVGGGLGPAVGRVGVNTAIGAGGGAVIEYVDVGEVTPVGVLSGAAFGAAFGLGSEVIGFSASRINTRYNVSGRIQETVPIPKYGDVTIPLEDGGVINYRGFYLSKGPEATTLLGRTSPVPKGVNISSNYVPESNIEARVTQDVMAKAGYSPESLQAISDVRLVMRTTQNTRVSDIDEVFPKQTGTLSPKGTSAVKEFVVERSGEVDMVYGSYATKPQLSKQFEYTYQGKSALREPGDIDIQLSTGQVGAERFAQDLVVKLQARGEPVRISSEKATLIEADVGGGKYAHAVDIHFKGEVSGDVTAPVTEKAWGFTFAKKPVTIERVPAMSLNEQGLRKGASIMGFTEEQGLGPKSWRGKDIPDFFQAQRTLLEVKAVDKSGEAFGALNRAADYYGVDELGLIKSDMAADFVYYPRVASPSRGGSALLAILGDKNYVPSGKDSPSKVYTRLYNLNGKYSAPVYNEPISPSVAMRSPSKALAVSSPLSLSASSVIDSIPISSVISPPSVPSMPSPSKPYSPVIDYPESYPISISLPISRVVRFDLPSGGQFNPMSGELPKRSRRSLYTFGLTEYPVVTAEEILGGKRKRK